MKRTFIAIKINLEKSTIKIISEIKEILSGERIKWVDLKNLHITLAFLGDTEKHNIEIVKNNLSEILINHKQFNITLTGIGVFKNFLNPRVLWMGFEKNTSLIQLHKEIANNLTFLDYHPDHSFNPHLTLGRINQIRNKGNLKKILDKYDIHYFQKLIITEIIYYESILGSSNPIYNPIAKFPLK